MSRRAYVLCLGWISSQTLLTNPAAVSYDAISSHIPLHTLHTQCVLLPSSSVLKISFYSHGSFSCFMTHIHTNLHVIFSSLLSLNCGQDRLPNSFFTPPPFTWLLSSYPPFNVYLTLIVKYFTTYWQVKYWKWSNASST